MEADKTQVGILTTSHSTFDSRVFYKEARSLADTGYDVTLITPHDKDTVRDGVKIRATGRDDVESAGFGDARQVYREARSIDADIYHFHDPGFLPFGVLLSYKTDAKIVYDHHEQYSTAFRRYDFPPDVLNPLMSLYPSMQSVACRRFDAIITTTEEATEDFRRRGHPNVVTVRNFPATEDISFSEPSLERDVEHLLVYVGGLDETRGFKQMLYLISELEDRGMDIGAWLIGPVGADERSMADEIGISEKVEFVGKVPHENIYSYLHEGDAGLALLAPDRFEQDIPLKLFEYMYSELAVITTPIGATSKFMDKEWSIVVPFDDTKKQADEVENLLQDPGRVERMGKKGREMVKEEYSWEKEKKRLLDLYENLSG